MNEAEEILSQLAEETPSQSQTIDDIIDLAFVPQGVDIPEPELVFGIGDIPMFTKKSLSVLKGNAKSGKTTVTAWITAQVINNHLNTLWIDTEQGMYYASRTQSWVLKIAGLPSSNHLSMYELKIHSPSKRIEIIEKLLSTRMFDMVVIDGIRDLVFDINNPDEATRSVGLLMKWADVYDCHLLSIIHQNKVSDHARGHLGTELINKSETVIKISKDDDGIVICEPEFTRGQPFEIFGFDRDAYGIPQIVTVGAKINTGESNTNRIGPTDIHRDQHIELLDAVFSSSDTLPYGELQGHVAASFSHYGVQLGVNKVKTFIAWYLQNGYLEKAEKLANKQFYKKLYQK